MSCNNYLATEIVCHVMLQDVTCVFPSDYESFTLNDAPVRIQMHLAEPQILTHD